MCIVIRHNWKRFHTSGGIWKLKQNIVTSTIVSDLKNGLELKLAHSYVFTDILEWHYVILWSVHGDLPPDFLFQ